MHGGSHIYGLPYPSADSLDPIDHFFTFDVSKIIPKNMHYFLYATFKPILVYIHGYDPQTRVHRDVCKITNIFGVFLTWFRITWLLAFQIPWEHSDLTVRYLFGELYIEPLVYIEGGEIEE